MTNLIGFKVVKSKSLTAFLMQKFQLSDIFTITAFCSGKNKTIWIDKKYFVLYCIVLHFVPILDSIKVELLFY